MNILRLQRIGVGLRDRRDQDGRGHFRGSYVIKPGPAVRRAGKELLEKQSIPIPSCGPTTTGAGDGLAMLVDVRRSTSGAFSRFPRRPLTQSSSKAV